MKTSNMRLIALSLALLLVPVTVDAVRVYNRGTAPVIVVAASGGYAVLEQSDSVDVSGGVQALCTAAGVWQFGSASGSYQVTHSNVAGSSTFNAMRPAQFFIESDGGVLMAADLTNSGTTSLFGQLEQQIDPKDRSPLVAANGTPNSSCQYYNWDTGMPAYITSAGTSLSSQGASLTSDAYTPSWSGSVYVGTRTGVMRVAKLRGNNYVEIYSTALGSSRVLMPSGQPAYIAVQPGGYVQAMNALPQQIAPSSSSSTSTSAASGSSATSNASSTTNSTTSSAPARHGGRGAAAWDTRTLP